MKIEIIEDKKQSLFVYNNDELLFYSVIKFNWLRRNSIKIFDGNDNLIIELKTYESPFRSSKYKIQFQDENIQIITEDYISVDENIILKNNRSTFLSFNQNCFYTYGENKVAETKQKLWNSPQKIILNIDEKYLSFLKFIVIHILSTKTGSNSNSD
ncbi:hypothetical protein ASE21_12530 [Flavobacterium sp. Root901]|uniref:hypothetical protein n=1 Tax=Flavobacterium sp. Root901 TaxID=1736605 RepID=UPI00071054F8|nr:hypothetical protein [Flavobacterium sp. Root901]KRD10516.1 hypothetical protein ASE21_12530 [Flavobacterium sp. Root901]